MSFVDCLYLLNSKNGSKCLFICWCYLIASRGINQMSYVVTLSLIWSASWWYLRWVFCLLSIYSWSCRRDRLAWHVWRGEETIPSMSCQRGAYFRLFHHVCTLSSVISETQPLCCTFGVAQSLWGQRSCHSSLSWFVGQMAGKQVVYWGGL